MVNILYSSAVKPPHEIQLMLEGGDVWPVKPVYFDSEVVDEENLQIIKTTKDIVFPEYTGKPTAFIGFRVFLGGGLFVDARLPNRQSLRVGDTVTVKHEPDEAGNSILVVLSLS